MPATQPTIEVGELRAEPSRLAVDPALTLWRGIAAQAHGGRRFQPALLASQAMTAPNARAAAQTAPVAR
jgi:hypothetical protein